MIKKAHEIFAGTILEEFIDEITGRNIKRVTVDKESEAPEAKFFIGKLLSINDEDNKNKAHSSKSFIQSVGVDFNITIEDIKNCNLIIKPFGDFYYRVYPTLEEQRNEMLRRINEGSNYKYLDYESLLSDYKKNHEKFNNSKIKLIPVYKKASLQTNEVLLDVKLTDYIDMNDGFGFIEKDSEINSILTKHIEALEQECMGDSDYYLYELKEKISILDLESKEKYDDFINKYSKKDATINQHWDLYFDASFKVLKGQCSVSITLINSSTNAYGNSNKKSSNKITIETLFNSGIEIKVGGCDLLPIEMDYFLDDYKYNRIQYVIGNNCSVEYNKEKKLICTNHLPVFIQNRFVTNDNLSVKFDDLIEKPLNTLRRIETLMNDELKKWNQYKNKVIDKLTSKGVECISKEISDFRSEIRRFSYGIEIIENYPIVLKSFVLMNKAFKLSNLNNGNQILRKGYDTWRLFQIVFIVSLIPDIASCDENLLLEEEKQKSTLDNMALLYFPTGGGKTEAFLGILIFNLFFDRYRGKKCGVTSILRYPLRLLSVQQVQRLSNILASSEILRRGCSDISDTEEFSLGYFVGDGNTPNKITKNDAEKKNTIKFYKECNSTELDEERIIDICPFCRNQSVHVRFNQTNHRLEHYCNHSGCVSGEKLPIYIVDNEIYRYLPSAIISTVDKLAIMGNNRNFRSLITGAKYECPKHGYTTTNKCIEKENANCVEEFNSFYEKEMYDPAPTLLIQDELHLINESLGSYASHYESFLHNFIRSTSNRGVKVIGATATISGYDMQVYHLYLKNAIKFPCSSIYPDKNFYAYTKKDDIQRRILSFSPYGKAIENSVVYSMKYMRKVVNKYYENPQLIREITNMPIISIDDAKKLLEDYWIFLEYNNIKRDSNNVEGALDMPINVELKQENIPLFKARKMTGDESFQDVRNVLAEVENSKNVFDGLNIIIATSMISHGVDADRFNLMFFYGMPGKVAEYIQAYSRTGRKYSSLVIDIMRPSRETDQSYLKNFIKMHEFKDILVDIVPINRWANKAIDSTFGGIFAATILNYYDEKLQYQVGGTLFKMSKIKEAINKQLILNSDVKKILYESYGITSGSYEDSLGGKYKEKIDLYVDKMFNGIIDRSWTEESIFEGFNLLGFNIMRSLRDTDEQLILELE